MPNTPPQKPNHTTPANPFGHLIATSFHSNGTTRSYHTYTPTVDTSTQNDPFRIGVTQAIKRRNGLSEGIVEECHGATEEEAATAFGHSRSWDSLAECPGSEDVEDTGDSGDSEGSDASSRTLGRSESSSSTLAADEDEGKETSESVEDEDESMEDAEDDGYGESETSSHTVGRSEDSNSGDDGGDKDGDEEMGESGDEGDVFGESYREGSRK